MEINVLRLTITYDTEKKQMNCKVEDGVMAQQLTEQEKLQVLTEAVEGLKKANEKK